MSHPFLATVFLAALMGGAAKASEKMAKVTAEVERINSLRENLVRGVQGEVTKGTFQAVCKPVGQQLKKFAKDNKFKVGQPTFKNRNPMNKPNAIQSEAIKLMEKDKDLVSLWRQADRGQYYFRRINVKAACLNCHGAKASRPDFIKKKYPKDKAYGFKEGDLRAMYSVFVPEG